MTAKTFKEMLDDIKSQGVVLNKTEASMKWLKTYVSQFSGKTRDKKNRGILTSGELMANEEENLKNNFAIGKMYMFFYDPKLKETLPYFDRFPCIFPIADKKGKNGERGFLGINFHYIPPDLRARMMDMLYDLENNARLTKNKRLQLSYEILMGMSTIFKPCLKHYLVPHVKSRFLNVPYEAWPIAMMLPLAQFEKKSSVYVWEESRKKI